MKRKIRADAKKFSAEVMDRLTKLQNSMDGLDFESFLCAFRDEIIDATEDWRDDLLSRDE